MNEPYLTVFSDTKGQNISPSQLGDQFKLLEGLYIVSSIDTDVLDSQPTRFDEFLHRRNLDLDHIKESDFFTAIQTYIDLFQHSILYSFPSIESQIQNRNLLDYIQPYMQINHLNNLLLDDRFILSFERNRKFNINRRPYKRPGIYIHELRYSNPIEFKLDAAKSWKALLIALVIAGGEVNFKDGYVKIPGLVEATERVTRLVIEVLDKDTERERNEIINKYIKENTISILGDSDEI